MIVPPVGTHLSQNKPSDSIICLLIIFEITINASLKLKNGRELTLNYRMSIEMDGITIASGNLVDCRVTTKLG